VIFLSKRRLKMIIYMRKNKIIKILINKL